MWSRYTVFSGQNKIREEMGAGHNSNFLSKISDPFSQQAEGMQSPALLSHINCYTSCQGVRYLSL